jgi:aerobic-type carbon monoxide dehydrogenase small subunit (CoxS/CutS family)
MSQQPQALSEAEQAALAQQTQPTETEVAELQTGEFSRCRQVNATAALVQQADLVFATDIHRTLPL